MGKDHCRKIHNQADFLFEKGKGKEAELLYSYISDIQPGDISNREGHAAKVYFNAIFGNGFKRGNGMAVDSALNYGYSLILSAFNREIVVCGFSTQLGIAHHNTFNQFNLTYMELMRANALASVFVFVNLRSLLDDETMEKFTATCCSNEYNIMLIDNREYNKLSLEKRTVIDSDLCEF